MKNQHLGITGGFFQYRAAADETETAAGTIAVVDALFIIGEVAAQAGCILTVP